MKRLLTRAYWDKSGCLTVLGNMNVISVAVYPTPKSMPWIKAQLEWNICLYIFLKSSHICSDMKEQQGCCPCSSPTLQNFRNAYAHQNELPEQKERERRERERSLAVCWFLALSALPPPASLLTDVFAELLSAFLAYSLAHSLGSCFPASIANVWIKRKDYLFQA